MFSGMGWETVAGCRQYFYIRHIDWGITCPLIIYSLGLLATQDLATILAGDQM
jgi:bacteriorhodopsin